QESAFDLNKIMVLYPVLLFFFSSRRRHTRFSRDWSSDVCSSDLIMHDTSSRLLDAFLHDLSTTLGVGQAGGQNFPQRRVGTQLFELLVAERFVLDPFPYLPEQMRRRDAARPPCPRPLDDDAQRRAGSQDDRQHDRTARVYH